MANTALFMTVLACTVSLFTARQASGGQDEPTALVLHVDNYARVPPEALKRAEEEASDIFSRAGIRTVWIHEGEVDEGVERSGRHLHVLLLCPVMTQQKVSKDVIGDEVLGTAGRGTGRAYVLTPRVIQVSVKRGRRFDVALGRVIAHEVGHLVLPPGSHSAGGIMQSSPNLWSRGALAFTARQQRQLQQELR